MLFLLTQSTKDDKVFLRLQSVWRDVWRELVEGRREKLDRDDMETLKRIRFTIAEERSQREAAITEEPRQKTAISAPSDMPRLPRRDGDSETAGRLKSLWEMKSSTTRFQKMLKLRQQLPIWDHREQVLNTVNAHPITILCAETGAGKSTQVPSFLLQNRLSAGKDCKILVTQPRRISAISLAQRVSAELGEPKSEIGTRKSLVGFAIRLESKVSSTTRITYVTTGVLVRMLESSNNLEETDILILDEVHERTMDLDLLFIAIRRLLKRRKDLKVVLMSATVDADKFSEYFDAAPILLVPGRSFPVDTRYLEDAIELTRGRDHEHSVPQIVEASEDDGSAADESERTRSLRVGLEKYNFQTQKILATYDEYKINYSLILQLIVTISSNTNLQKFSKATLVFMPGIAEIRRLHQMISSSPIFQTGWVVHLLHSSFSNDDLERAFEHAPPKHRKIVIATNIAETGITIPDVTAVIDTCREKVMRFDERRQLSKLNDAFISRSSARQRRGRAARVQEGLCFHLVTRYRTTSFSLSTMFRRC